MHHFEALLLCSLQLLCNARHCLLYLNVCYLFPVTTYLQNPRTEGIAHHIKPHSPFCSISKPSMLQPLQVVMTHWKDPEPPDWSNFAPKLRQLWHNPKWSRSIYVDDASLAPPAHDPSPQGAPATGHLHNHLQRTTAKACSICDPQAQRPFPSNVALSKHVSMQHHWHMCPVCLDVSTGLSVPMPEQVLLQVFGCMHSVYL